MTDDRTCERCGAPLRWEGTTVHYHVHRQDGRLVTLCDTCAGYDR